MRIYLIGYMASGKSVIGKKLAKYLRARFLDTDKMIEKQQGMLVKDIFQEYGEQAFREMEKQALLQTLSQNNIVVSCGGGLPCFFDNMQKINEGGISVYLKVSEEELFKRIENQRENRPVLMDVNDQYLRTFIKESLEKRVPIYEKSSVVIEGDCIDVAQVVKAIDKYLI